MKWGEWYRHYDVVLDYSWPSNSISEGGSYAFSWLWVTETTESENKNKGRLLYLESCVTGRRVSNWKKKSARMTTY